VRAFSRDEPEGRGCLAQGRLERSYGSLRLNLQVRDSQISQLGGTGNSGERNQGKAQSSLTAAWGQVGEACLCFTLVLRSNSCMEEQDHVISIEHRDGGNALGVSDDLEVESVGDDLFLSQDSDRDVEEGEEEIRPASAPQLTCSGGGGGGKQILVTSSLRKRDVVAMFSKMGKLREVRRIGSSKVCVVFLRSRDAKSAVSLASAGGCGEMVRVDFYAVSQDDSVLKIENAAVKRRDARRVIPERIKRKCSWCPRIWTGSLYLTFTCCFLIPFGNYVAVQTGFIYVVLYPACLLECVFWFLYHCAKLCISLARDLESLCFCSRGGCKPCRKKGISKHASHIAAYCALFLTLLIPLWPLRHATRPSDGDWESRMLPTIVGPLSPLRLTLLTTLGADRNYAQVAKEPEFWEWLRGGRGNTRS
jgi:hypothetical protein